MCLDYRKRINQCIKQPVQEGTHENGLYHRRFVAGAGGTWVSLRLEWLAEEGTGPSLPLHSLVAEELRKALRIWIVAVVERPGQAQKES